MTSRDVHKVTVAVTNPRGDDPGTVSFGYYTIDGDLLTMTDGNGAPIRRTNGELWTWRLLPGDEPRRIAGRLTREIRTAVHGRDNGFGRRLTYPNIGVA